MTKAVEPILAEMGQEAITTKRLLERVPTPSLLSNRTTLA
jgi:hypothetical protein